MPNLASVSYILRAITVSAAFMIGSTASATGSSIMAGAPQGFEDLASERQLVLDAYFGGRKIGEVSATVVPGSLTFDRPDQVAALVPEATNPTELATSLSGPLPTNVAFACGFAKRETCGNLRPTRAAIIFDEARFRVDLFVHSDLLARPELSAATYLPSPDDEPSVVSLFGATLSGSSRSDNSWHVQNRTIGSIGNARLRSDSSLSKHANLTFDNLSVEADRNDWRYAGGLFWAPGTELIGRRKIMGIGVSTQIDTRVDKTALMSTPLSVSLQQPGKVDLLVDGRIISSRIYPAGNRLIETANLPNGSYEVTIRVQEDGLPVREERQFFTKGTPIAPAGRPLLSAFAGFIPSSERSPSLKSEAFFYEATAAYRIDQSWGVDAALLGTQDKAIVEGGAILLTRFAQVRAAALLSTSTDYGLLLRASSVSRGPLSLSFDLRKVHSSDGRPLLPVTVSRGTFSEDPATGYANRGSYTQLLSILGYRLGQANLRFTGLYRKNGSDHSTYSLGAAAEVPVVRSNSLDVLLQGDLRKTESGFASFFGIRLLTNQGRFDYSGSAGVSSRSHSRDKSTRVVSEAQAGWYDQLGDQGQIAANGAYGRDQDGSYARATASARLPMINVRTDMLHQFADHGDTTQYSATLESGIVVAGDRLSLAARDMNDTGILVSVSGGQSGQKFDIMVDEVVRATVSNGTQVALYLQPYQRYDVRLRPSDGLLASLDTAPRQVTLFPGSVAALDWKFKPLFILFGRVIDGNGKPVADADINWPDGIGRTDAEGYFQIETAGGHTLQLSDRNGRSCMASITMARPTNEYYSAGDVRCQ